MGQLVLGLLTFVSVFFVWLLLWLWDRFFNMVVACAPLVVDLKKWKKQYQISLLFLQNKSLLHDAQPNSFVLKIMLHYLIVEKLVDFEENRAVFCFGLDLLFRFARAIGLVQNIAEIPQKCGVRFYKEASRIINWQGMFWTHKFLLS